MVWYGTMVPDPTLHSLCPVSHWSTEVATALCGEKCKIRGLNQSINYGINYGIMTIKYYSAPWLGCSRPYFFWSNLVKNTGSLIFLCLWVLNKNTTKGFRKIMSEIDQPRHVFFVSCDFVCDFTKMVCENWQFQTGYCDALLV